MKPTYSTGLLFLLLLACNDEGSEGEELPEGAFTTSAGSLTTTSSSTTRSSGSDDDGPGESGVDEAGPDDTTTSSTTSTTSDSGSETMGVIGDDDSSTTQVGDDTTTTGDTTTGDTTTTDDGTTTTDATTDDGVDPTTEATTEPPPACGDGSIDDGEVCFGAATPFAIGTGTPVDIVAGDFDNDTALDLAVITDANVVSVVLGLGDGSFDGATDYAVGNGPSRVRSANLNADNNADLAVVHETDGTFGVLLADGAGGFNAIVSYTVGTGPVDLALGDLSGEGSIDVAVGNPGSTNFHSATNDGDGAFTVFGPFEIDAIAPRGVVIGNFGNVPGGGNFNDVAFGGGVSFRGRAGEGGDAFDEFITQNDVAATDLRRMDLANLNAGLDDLAAVDDAGIWIALGQSGGRFQSQLYPTDTPSEVLLRDVTGEGDIDAVVSNRGTDTVTVFVGDGTGAVAASTPIDVGDEPVGVATGDFNGDGVDDIATANATDANITVVLSNP